MKKKSLMALLSIVFIASATSCGGTQVGGGEDTEGKTTIQVATYNGGLGMDWLKDAAKQFEELYKDASFETGKTGVSVKISECEGGDMLATRTLNKDVYLTENVDYFTQYVNKGKLADISDVVTEKLTEFGESKSISDKLDTSMNSYLTAKDGKYYAIPFYDGIYGFIYNVDMFEENGWFFDESGNFTSTDKSKGIDGIAGTYDDGLPQTYSQFEKLIAQIRDNSDKTPFLYGLDVQDSYTNRAMISFWSDYEGKDKMDVNYSLSGNTDIIESFDADGNPVIGYKKIDVDNHSKLQQQPGKYYALKFLDDILCGDTKNYQAVAAGYSQAQFNFIAGDLSTTKGAMLIDGIWWENEAEIAGHFDSVSKQDYGYDASQGSYRATQHYAFMPIPQVDAVAKTDGSHKQTLFSLNSSYCFIASEVSGAKLDVSKKFLQFLHTDAQLSAFTVRTSITRSLNYTISEEQKAQATPYGQSVIEMKNSSDIVYPYSDAEYFINNSAQFSESAWVWKARVDTKQVISPFEEFKNNNMDARKYFEGLLAAH